MGAEADVGQADAVIERIVANFGNTVGHRIAAGQSTGSLDEQRLMLVKKNPVGAAIKQILLSHGDRRQTLTIRKGPAADVGHAAGNRDASQTGAVIERIGSYAG